MRTPWTVKGITGNKGMIVAHKTGKREGSWGIAIYFEETGNYVPRPEKPFAFEASLGSIRIQFNGGQLYEQDCEMIRAADSKRKDFSAATSDIAFCSFKGHSAELLKFFKRHRYADISIKIEGGEWAGRPDLDGFGRVSREIDQQYNAVK